MLSIHIIIVLNNLALKEHISKGSTSVIIQTGLNNNATDKLPDAENIDYLLKAKIHGNKNLVKKQKKESSNNCFYRVLNDNCMDIFFDNWNYSS